MPIPTEFGDEAPDPMLEQHGENAFDFVLHDGSAPARIQWYFLDHSQLPVAVQMWELPPGGAEGMHSHMPSDEPLEELYVVIEGQARMHIGSDVFNLSPGDAALAPVGSEHNLRNTGDVLLRVMVVWGKPGDADWSGFGTAKVARRQREL